LTPPTIRALLPHTFAALLGRFHRLTPIQKQGIPPILAGRDVLLSAPSASGKTEAYLAPLLERLLEGHTPGLLIVSPTRALANDLRRRLESPLAQLGVSLGRYTGEHKERVTDTLPQISITTPEALDSLLARHPSLLDGVGAVVLDEIHLLDGNPRGDQLRILLHRLGSLARRHVQRLAASATVAEAEALAGRYLSAPLVVKVTGTRRIYARGFYGADLASLARHLTELANHGFRKLLVFCNSRNAVEWVAIGLAGRTPFSDALFTHHGSLSQGQRERVERRFQEAPAAVAVATLTLELGIDVGTVDYVLLRGVPPGIDSMLQRIGRGNRRTGISRVGYVYESAGERLLYRVMLDRAVHGDLCAPPYAFRPGVLVQQALVLAGSLGHLTAERLKAVVPPAIEQTLPGDWAGALLEKMVGADLLERAPAHRYVLGEGAEQRYAAGRLHGNIAAVPEMDVVDRLTGGVVGRVAIGGEPVRDTLRLGGHGRRPVAAREGQVLTDVVSRAGPARFPRRGVPPVPFALARAIAAQLGADAGQVLFGRSGAHFVVLHGLGTTGALLLGQLTADALSKRRVLRVTPFTLRLAAPPRKLPQPGPPDLLRVLRQREHQLAALCAMGPYQRHLPVSLRRDAVRGAADLDGVAAFLARAELVEISSPEVPTTWLEL
jgi:ATP-dependent Lhr-like helicase